MTPRHKWDSSIRLQHKTERCCVHCGTVKVTRHEPGERPWVEFWRGLDKLDVSGTPACERVP